jgi:hypothetical protein
MEEKSLMQYLEDINTYKEAIKNAINEKGGEHYMDNVSFSGYAEKIKALQFESGDTPSTPTPSADYIYSNGYIESKNEIINFVPYEIVLDDNGKFIIELNCPEEIPGYIDGDYGYRDVIFTIDVPTTYNITNFELFEEGGGIYVNQKYKTNPRHETVVRNGVVYNSYVRLTNDEEDYGSADVQYDPLQYRITIEKK